MLDPCCEQAILGEEGACSGGRTRRSCRGVWDGISKAAQLLTVLLVPVPTAGKDTQGQLQEELAWLLAGK